MAEKKRILLAEDDPAILKMTAARLAYEGFAVVTATDGEEVLNQVSANGTFDLLLMDIKMPKLDGFQVCQRLKANPATAKIPIVIFTGSLTTWQRLTNQCIDLGISGWVKKPFTSEELLEKVHRALGPAGAVGRTGQAGEEGMRHV